MSSIVINPTRRAENSIYLAFSILAVVSLQYGYAICTEQSNYEPNILTIAVAGPLLAAFLMYPAFEKRWLEKRLTKRVEKELGKMVDFPLLSIYLLESYKIITQKVPKASEVLINKTQDVLDGEELSVSMWRLRAAILFILSIPFTGIVAYYYISDTLIRGLLLFAFIVLVEVIRRSSVIEYENTSNTLSSLVQFHWFDELLTTVRRTEVTPDYNKRIIDLQIEGLVANMYVARITKPKGIGTGTGKPPVTLERERSKYPVTVKGFTQQVEPTRAETRKYNSLLAEECTLLRELTTLRDWPRFNSRFSVLRNHIIPTGQTSLNGLRHTIGMLWEPALLSGNEQGLYSQQFNKLRLLLCQTAHFGLIPSDLTSLVNFILKPSLKSMTDWSFSYEYYLRFGERTGRLDSMFRRYMHDKVKDRGWEPTPVDEEALEYLDKERMYQESWVEHQERERYGSNYDSYIRDNGKFKIFQDVDEDMIQNPELEPYDYDCPTS